MVMAGDPVYASDINDLEARFPILVLKGSDEGPVASNITPQDDDELVLPVAASTTYTLEAWIGYSCTSDAPDFRCDFTIPAGATLVRSVYGLAAASTATSGSVEYSRNPTAGTDDGRGSVNGSLSIYVVGTLIVSTTAGSIQFRWAQVNSNAAGITVLANSWMKLTAVP